VTEWIEPRTAVSKWSYVRDVAWIGCSLISHAGSIETAAGYSGDNGANVRASRILYDHFKLVFRLQGGETLSGPLRHRHRKVANSALKRI